MSTSIQITALDGVVHVNSLFTLAVFLGLTWNPNDPSNSLIADVDCNPPPHIAEHMISFHVYSFSCFLFSSLIAFGLKQAIRLSKNNADLTSNFLGQVNKNFVRVGTLVSGAGSVCGCTFLMLALINVVQIKLGTLSCGSGHSFAAVVPLIILVPAALLFYICIVSYAFLRK